ncbi:hypothetical protein D3C77_535820 [compost metagenome]
MTHAADNARAGSRALHLIEKESPHAAASPLHPVEDHPARRPVPAGHCRPAGNHIAGPGAAQRGIGQPGQHRNARQQRAPAPAGPRRNPGAAHPALFHGRLPVRQWLCPPGAGAQGPWRQRPARRTDAPGPRQPGRQPGCDRPVPGVPAQRPGPGQPVPRPGCNGQQRERALLAVLVTTPPRHLGA